MKTLGLILFGVFFSSTSPANDFILADGIELVDVHYKYKTTFRASNDAQAHANVLFDSPGHKTAIRKNRLTLEIHPSASPDTVAIDIVDEPKQCSGLSRVEFAIETIDGDRMNLKFKKETSDIHTLGERGLPQPLRIFLEIQNSTYTLTLENKLLVVPIYEEDCAGFALLKGEYKFQSLDSQH